MDETLISCLCDKTWKWDPDSRCAILFKKDGTGELTCGVELVTFIAAEFDWKLDPGSKSLTAPANLDSDLLAEINMEVTLTKRRMSKLGTQSTDGWLVNEHNLSDSAFLPKSYTIHIEKGRFPLARGNIVGGTWWHRYRLLFDKSPYPPLEEWAHPGANAAARGNKFWERVDFQRDEIEVTTKEGVWRDGELVSETAAS